MAEPLPYLPLDRAAQYLRGVGPKRADQLARIGIRTARDLLYHVPRRYEDASTVTPIGALQVGMDATVIGTVFSKGVLPTRSGLRIFQAILTDGTANIECAWPGQPFLDRIIRRGDVLLVTGGVRFFHGRQLTPREYIVLGHEGEADAAELAGRVLPIYGATEGVSQRLMRTIVESNLPTLLREAEPEEVFSPAQLKRAGVQPLREALEHVHNPPTIRAAETALRRLVYEELFFLQLLAALAHRRATRSIPGHAHERKDHLIAALYRALPFELTAAQTRVIKEIFGDMAAPIRMNRLIQGDVGSGKTVVALFAMLLAAENGFQSALMAPTEILAEQHARTLRHLLGDLPVRVTLLTGRVSAPARRAALAEIAGGEAQIVVGTHALIQEHVSFHQLGLAIIDEQHRFGVKQRMALAELGSRPDVLVMSATPIPRSLALTLYGDLDLSVIDELPPGRQEVRTAIRPEGARGKVYDFVREEVQAGRQAYIVYPLVEESEKVDLKAATAEFERLRTDDFADLRLGLVHGQMGGEEKEATMQAFVAGDVDVLVSTTVIEVGIDVANATVMIIEHAERFGLSQLHQLRGRVGRGAAASYCILLTDESQDSERLRTFASTNDGFEIARADLRIRGMGDFFGARQHGVPELRFYDPEKHEDLLLRAREDARAMIEADPKLEKKENSKFRQMLRARYAERAKLYDIG